MFWDKLIRKLVHNRILVVIIAAAIVVAGCYSYYIIPKKENPNTRVAAATIVTVYPGASPEEVDDFVTQKIEDALFGIDDIASVQSSSVNSASVQIIMYKDDIHLDDVLSELKDTVENVQGTLPSMCQTSVVTPVFIDTTQFIIAVSGEAYTQEDLVDYADTIRSSLLEVAGVTKIDIDGERTRQVSVNVDIDKLRMYGISIENILSLMQAQNISIPSGSIDYESGSIVVNTPSVFETLADIENTVVSGSSSSVAFVKLKDIAKVSIEYADAYYFTQDGENAVMLVGYFDESLNSVIVGERVRKALDTVSAQLPADVDLHELLYSPDDVDDSIGGFIISLIESVILIVVVVMIGVQLRNGIIISVSIPLSIFMTFMIMLICDIEFQFISIAALIVSLGILVDNAIVISEAIQQHLNAGDERTEAVIAAVRETYKSILTSTLTTIATFGILFFIPGIIGMVVATIPTVVIAALGSSYAVAMLLTPVFGYMFFKPETEKRIQKVSIIKKFFLKLLDVGLKHKKLFIAGAFATLAVAIILALGLGIKFFPASDKAEVYINIDCETASLSHTARVVDDVEKVLAGLPLVDNYSSAIGSDLPKFFITVADRATSKSSAQIAVQLNETEFKKCGSAESAASAIQTAVDAAVTGGTITVRYLEYSIPTEAAITLYVSGDNLPEINTAADLITEQLEQVAGAYNVRNTTIEPEYEYVVKLDSEILSTYGVLKYDVVKQINTSLMGASSATYNSGGTEMDIVVKADIQSLDDLYALPITSSVTGNAVELRQIATIELAASAPLVKRYNGKLYVSVLSSVKSGYSAFSIESELNRRLDGIELGNVEIQSMGEFTNMTNLLSNLVISGPIAILIIFITIYLQFHSFKKVMIIITSIPLSLIGCCLGLVIFNMDIQAMAILGAISLFGIVVNNGIVLLEYMEQKRATGASIYETCMTGVSMRCRPIMLTSITTCIGLVPLIVAGDPMTAPMASVLLFGMLLSTLLTMAIVPVLYSMVLEQEERKAAKQ